MYRTHISDFLTLVNSSGIIIVVHKSSVPNNLIYLEEFSSLVRRNKSETSSVCVRSCCRQNRVCLLSVWNSFYLLLCIFFLCEAHRNDETVKQLMWKIEDEIYANCERLFVVLRVDDAKKICITMKESSRVI